MASKTGHTVMVQARHRPRMLSASSGDGRRPRKQSLSHKVASALLIPIKSSTFSYASSGTGSRHAEPRCIKYSAIVQPRKVQASPEKYDFEAVVWSEAFNSMGQLAGQGLKEERPFYQLNKAPYHCSSLARVFKPFISIAALYFIITSTYRFLAVFRYRIFETVKYYAIKNSAPPKWLLYGSKPNYERYLPPSSIRLKWGIKADIVEQICEWLVRTFGPFLFIMREGPHSMIVVYEDIWTPYALVNSCSPHGKLLISWVDPRFYNFGHLNCFSVMTMFPSHIIAIDLRSVGVGTNGYVVEWPIRSTLWIVLFYCWTTSPLPEVWGVWERGEHR